MQQSKLGLDFEKVNYAKGVSKKIAEEVSKTNTEEKRLENRTILDKRISLTFSPSA